MNRLNLDRLISKLEQMKRESPQDFNYMQGYSLDEPHCVDCVCRELMGRAEYIGGHGASIRVFLDVSPATAQALWSPFLSSDSLFGRTPHYAAASGEVGITEALRRLYILRDSDSARGDKEQAFLIALKASLRDIESTDSEVTA